MTSLRGKLRRLFQFEMTSLHRQLWGLFQSEMTSLRGQLWPLFHSKTASLHEQIRCLFRSMTTCFTAQRALASVSVLDGFTAKTDLVHVSFKDDYTAQTASVFIYLFILSEMAPLRWRSSLHPRLSDRQGQKLFKKSRGSVGVWQKSAAGWEGWRLTGENSLKLWSSAKQSLDDRQVLYVKALVKQCFPRQSSYCGADNRRQKGQ